MVEGPSIATVADFDGVEACVNACFIGDATDGGMAARHPHCLQRAAEHMGQYLVIKDAGRVVSCLLIADQKVIVDGSEMRVAGIGQVATLPEYRGRQLMTVLLDTAIDRMRERGFALSELGGDRVRYGRFGWDRAGREWHFTLTPRSVENRATPPSLPIRRYAGDAGDLRDIADIHDAEPRRVERSEQRYRDLMNRKDKTVWLAGEGPAVAYLVHEATRTPAMVFEFGGNLDALHALLAHVVTAETLVCSPWSHPANALLFDLASGWQLASPRMIRIMDLHATLSAFRRQIEQRIRAAAPALRAEQCLRISETGESAALLVRDGRVDIAAGEQAAPCVELPRRAMARLLFGPASPEVVVASPPPLLDAVLPLDFTIWRNETV